MLAGDDPLSMSIEFFTPTEKSCAESGLDYYRSETSLARGSRYPSTCPAAAPLGSAPSTTALLTKQTSWAWKCSRISLFIFPGRMSSWIGIPLDECEAGEPEADTVLLGFGTLASP